MTIQNLSDLDLTTKLGDRQISSKYKLTLRAKGGNKKKEHQDRGETKQTVQNCYSVLVKMFEILNEFFADDKNATY